MTDVDTSTLCHALQKRKTNTKMADSNAEEDHGDVKKVCRHVEKRDT